MHFYYYHRDNIIAPDWLCAFLNRRSSQLPPLLLQSQLPHTESKQAPFATHPQQPRPHHQGKWQLYLIVAIMLFFILFFFPDLRLNSYTCIIFFSVAKTTNNQLFCSVKNMEREQRGLFGVEMNATLPADWKHNESRKTSGLFGFVILQKFDKRDRVKRINSHLQANKYFMVHYNLNQKLNKIISIL